MNFPTMTTLSSRLSRGFLLAVLLLPAALGLHAQTRATTNTGTNANRGTTAQSGIGGGGGAGAGSASNSSSTTTGRTYVSNTMVGDAMITSDVETRKLIVVADDETNDKIRAIIQDLDKPKPQVLINVVFLQITHTNDLDLGLDATYTKTNGNTTTTVQTLFNATDTGAFYKLVNTNLNATVHALATLGKTEIISRPSIVTRSSQQATIMIGQEIPIVTNSRVTDTGSTINTVQYQSIGIILRVTPFITQDGKVEMIVSPEISSLSSQTVAISATASTPVIDKRSADTVIVTPSDNTIVIGGLISNEMTNTDSQVPILGDIPLLGAAFKRKVKSNTRTELMIFMTPHVVLRPEDLTKLGTAEESKLELKADSIKPAQARKLEN